MHQKWNKSHRVKKGAEARACWALGLGKGRWERRGIWALLLHPVHWSPKWLPLDAFLLQDLLLPCTPRAGSTSLLGILWPVVSSFDPLLSGVT